MERTARKKNRILDSRAWLAQTHGVVEDAMGMRGKFLDVARTEQKNTNDFTDMGGLVGEALKPTDKRRRGKQERYHAELFHLPHPARLGMWVKAGLVPKASSAGALTTSHLHGAQPPL